MLAANLIIIILLLFFHFTGLSSQEWLKVVPGLLLICYLPGYNLNNVLFTDKIKSYLQWYGRVAFDILSSLTIIYFSYYIFKGTIGYDADKMVLFVAGLNILLVLFSLLLHKKNNNISFNWRHFWKEHKVLLVIFAIPIILFGIRLWLNPYIYEIDSQLYINQYNDIFKYRIETSFPGMLRNAFVLYMILFKYVAGLNYVAIFKFFTPLLFNLTAFSLFIFCRQIKDKKIGYLSYLLIVASPILTVMNEGVRPETFLLVFSIPTLILLFLAVSQRNVLLGLTAFVYSIAAFKFHEFGIMLIGASLLTLIIIVYQRASDWIAYLRRKWLFVLIILIPYAILLKMNFQLIIGLMPRNEIFGALVSLIKRQVTHLHWDWWFLNEYTAIDGGKIGWPGYSFLIYYAYNGVLLILGALIILGLYFKYKAQSKRIELIIFIPWLVYFLISFSFAEILPRIGIYFLPNRLWPHISMIFIILTVLILKEMLIDSRKEQKIVTWLLYVMIIFGIAGTVLGSTFMGTMVLPQEKRAIEAMRKMDDRVVFFSAQPNMNLVKIYGEKDFYRTRYMKRFVTKADFRETLIKASDEQITKSLDLFLNNIDIYYNSSYYYLYEDKIFGREKELISIKTNSEKLKILQKGSERDYRAIKLKADNIANSKLRPKYFIYSFAKFRGLMAMRAWWKIECDQDNLEFFKNYSGPDVVYKDNNTIIIRIK